MNPPTRAAGAANAGNAPLDAVRPGNAPLEAAVAAVEDRLQALREALGEHDSSRIEHGAIALHDALAVAARVFVAAAREGAIAPALRNRLALTAGLVAAQRESLARATASLDRAIDVLMPRDGVSLYSALGPAERGVRNESIKA